MRVAVTGQSGQVVQALIERSGDAVIVPLGRPEFDLLQPASIDAAIAAAQPDVVVNAAAYTAVDLAESEAELAHRINADGAGAVAAAAARLGVPVIQLSTDYVFDGTAARPYTEDDLPNPISVYGVSKLAGERAVAAANPDHVVLRTSWVYGPFGKNFVRTMLSLAQSRNEVSVVADQHGAPTSALDIADGVLAVARNLLAQPQRQDLRGTFHMASAGETNWAAFALAIFAASASKGGPSAQVRPVTTADYPTAARRPANSRLDCSRLAATHGVRLPAWRESLRPVVTRLLGTPAATTRSAP